MVDYPDGTLPITVSVYAELLSQMRQLPWWVLFAPQRIILLDDMEGTLKWIQEDGTVELAQDIGVYEGLNALKLTTGASANDLAQAVRWFGYSGLSKMMLQLRWNIVADPVTAFHSINFRVKLNDGTNDYTAWLRYLYHDTDYRRKWQYYDGVYKDIPDGSQNIMPAIGTERMHHNLCFIFDFSAGVQKLQRLIADGLDLDLSTLDMFIEANVTYPHAYIDMILQTDEDVAINAYVDTLCLSDNEL